MPSHLDLIRRAFADQATRFDASGTTLTSAEYLAWMVACLPLTAGQRVLDVAAGTGLLARALAPRVAQVVAVDVTPEMLRAAAAAIARDGCRKLLLVAGLAENLPFPAGSFDLVASRLALHHLVDPLPALREMRRVCRPGGLIAVIDLLAPAARRLRHRYNDLERRRDPSHTRALAREELLALGHRAGLKAVFDQQRDIEVDVERWLATTAAAAEVREEIFDCLQRELQGEAKTGMRPLLREGRLAFRQSWGIFLLEP